MGTEYGMCLKIESATNITITPPANSKVTLVFDGAGKRFKLDGKRVNSMQKGGIYIIGGKKVVM